MKHQLIVSASPGVYQQDKMIYRAVAAGNDQLESFGASVIEAVGGWVISYGGHFNIEVLVK